MKFSHSLVLPALLLGACEGHTCTAMGCEEGVTLEFGAPLVEDGQYTFTLTTETNTVTCRAFIPLRRDGTEPGCEGMGIHREEITTRTDDSVHGRSGDTIVSVSISGIHDTLTIDVTHEGTSVLQEDVTPDYEGVEINGEGCGECLMATHKVGS